LSANASVRVRVEAARSIARVMAGANLDTALAKADTQDFTPQNLSLLKALSYGVLRDYSLLSALLARMMDRQLNNEPELHALMLGGLFQLRSMRVATHAAVNETVEATVVLGKEKLRGLMNALLRRYQREREALEALLPPYAAQKYSYPDWLADEIKKDWPQQWAAVMQGGNEQGPLTLRVNRRSETREKYRQSLAGAGLAAQDVAGAADALWLEQALPVDEIPGFTEGVVSVQDASAQLAADVLDAQPKMRVLDACAAPGGKTAHLLERVDALELLALDIDESRLARVQQNLSRLRLDARMLAADVLNSHAWWDRQAFDRILLDAPCSGTGVIRRHPDIKWLRRATDIPKLAQGQLRMLDALWPMLAPGGVLVYATCSILKAEGEDVIKTFLKSRPDAKHLAIAADWGEARVVGRRIAPGGAWDGFYYAKLQKR
jgi:16S rRNA (cytosine967-C5)-methyltransferase